MNSACNKWEKQVLHNAYLRRQQRVYREFRVDPVRECLEELRDSLLESWLHFGRHDFPVGVQEEIHSVGQHTIAIEQVVQVYIGLIHVQVHIKVGRAKMYLPGLLRLITFVLNGSYDIDIRPVATRQTVPDYRQ